MKIGNFIKITSLMLLGLIFSCATYNISYDKFDKTLTARYYLGEDYVNFNEFKSMLIIRHDQQKKSNEYFIIIRSKHDSENSIAEIDKVITDTNFTIKGEVLTSTNKEIVYYDDFDYPYDLVTTVTTKNIIINTTKFSIPESEFVKFTKIKDEDDTNAEFKIYAGAESVVVSLNKSKIKQLMEEFKYKIENPESTESQKPTETKK